MKPLRLFPTALAVAACLVFSDNALGKPPKEADTLDELTKMYNDSACWECHADIHKEWAKSYHADPINAALEGIRNFIQVGLAQEWKVPLSKIQLLKCLDCHAPIVNFASEKLAREVGGWIVTAQDQKDTPAGQEAKKNLARLTVGCTACHNIKAITVDPGLRGGRRAGVVYGPTGARSEAHESVATVELKRSAFCMQCHGIYTSPDGETTQCNTLSGSFQNAYLNLGGSKTCQDCHMKEKNRGHYFPGGHDMEMVKEGLGLDVEITKYSHLPGKIPGVKDPKGWVPSAVVTAFVQNRAGHRIPDG